MNKIKLLINKIIDSLNKLSSHTYDLKKSILIIAILSLFSIIFQAIFQNGISLWNYLGYLKSPLLLLFNLLPVFLLITFFYFITNSISKSFIIINLPFTIILIINHYKVYFRDTPLTLNDFFSAKEAFSIIQNYTLEFNLRIIILSIIMIFTFVILLKYLNNTKNTLTVRALGILLTILLFFISYFAIYQHTELYKKVYTPINEYYDVDIVGSKGLIYSLVSKENLKTVYTKPANYSSEKIEELKSTYQTLSVSQKKMPNVIAIMSEAFFDPQEAENLTFYPNKNPLKNFNKLKEDSYYGNIIVPGFAGATASTEFEFLTGMNIFTIDSSMPDIYKTHITSKVYSIVNIFNDLDYETVAIHPGFDWFYNRNSVYKYMEFDKMIFKSDLPDDVEMVNYYVSDNVTSDLIIDNYKKHLEESPNTGYFNFTITIQNHGPYMDYKTDREPSVVKPDNMDEKLYNIVNNYMNGLNDADNLLGNVTNYVSELDTPTVVLFFGDHLPYFDAELQAYKDIGYNITDDSLESLKLKHSTPYLIWANDSAKKLITEQGGTIMQGEGQEISSNYLGLELLKYINMDLPPFFNFIDKLQEKINIISQNYYFSENNFHVDLTSELNELINAYKIWEYYNIREQK